MKLTIVAIFVPSQHPKFLPGLMSGESKLTRLRFKRVVPELSWPDRSQVGIQSTVSLESDLRHAGTKLLK